MILGSHNSWTYLKPKKWWMKLISFTARCQETDIYCQYTMYNTRCFDLRVRFNGSKLIIAHGIIEYGINKEQLLEHLKWLNDKGDVSVRILHEVRTKNEHTDENINKFANFCYELIRMFPKLKFWCGKNLYNWENDYTFDYDPSCEEKYSSVCNPKIIDDWYPKWFANRNNKEIKEIGTDKNILLIDFVDIL
jgi:hypothetical protein